MSNVVNFPHRRWARWSKGMKITQVEIGAAFVRISLILLVIKLWPDPSWLAILAFLVAGVLIGFTDIEYSYSSKTSVRYEKD